VRALPYFVFLSLFFHLTALLLLLNTNKVTFPEVFEASIIFEERKQIVSPSENKESPPEETKNISDHDSSAKKEIIKRSDEPNRILPSPPGQASRPDPRFSASSADADDRPSRPDPRSSSPDSQKLSTLKLSQESLLKSLITDQKPNLSAGVQDYLPSVSDGEITMLNAKADKFATFVRRVAEQVFAQIKGGGFLGLSIAELQKIEGNVRFRAVLSPKGELLRIESIFSSGVSSFDNVVKRAVEKGALDPNPPSAAAGTDGNFYFLFESRARGWIEESSRGRNERRWLLLSTGLE